MAVTPDPPHNGTPPAIKYDERSVTSYSGWPNAAAALRAQTGSPFVPAGHIWSVCGQESPQNDYVVLRHETPSLTVEKGI